MRHILISCYLSEREMVRASMVSRLKGSGY